MLSIDSGLRLPLGRRSGCFESPSLPVGVAAVAAVADVADGGGRASERNVSASARMHCSGLKRQNVELDMNGENARTCAARGTGSW